MFEDDREVRGAISQFYEGFLGKSMSGGPILMGLSSGVFPLLRLMV